MGAGKIDIGFGPGGQPYYCCGNKQNDGRDQEDMIDGNSHRLLTDQIPDNLPALLPH